MDEWGNWVCDQEATISRPLALQSNADTCLNESADVKMLIHNIIVINLDATVNFVNKKFDQMETINSTWFLQNTE